MSRCNSGLLVAQLLECLGAPLTEEQVWGLCYEICRSFVDTSNTNVEEDESSSSSRVVFELDTVYVRKEGSVAFVLNWNRTEEETDSEDISVRQMNGFRKVLLDCLENGVSEVERSAISSDLETLLRNLAQGGNLRDTHGHWVHQVSDCCANHASWQSVSASEYYRRVCKGVVNEALVIGNFLEVLRKEFQLLRPHDALCTLQLFQTRPTVRSWLQVMSEIRHSSPLARVTVVSSSVASHSVEGARETSSGLIHQRTPVIPQSPSVPKPARLSMPGIAEQKLPEITQLGKPTYFSTPSASCKPARKLLRPPQRLVDQVTSWMLEAEELSPENGPDSRPLPGLDKPGNKSPGTWSELDSQGFDHDSSGLSWKYQSSVSSCLGWFRETKRIRHVLTELQLDTLMENESLYESLQTGKICFCCRRTRFSLFSKWGVECGICERKACASCVSHATARDLGMTSRDQVEVGKGVFRRTRRAFGIKARNDERYVNVCKDCQDFIQRFY